MKNNENTILVTGGASGIGLGLAIALHQRGNRVVIAGRRRKALDEIAAAHPGIEAITLDIQDATSLKRLTQELQDRFPDLNVLVNNAGVSRAEDWVNGLPDVSLAEEMISTNILGTLRLTAALLPHLQRQAFATILTTTSNLAFLPVAIYPTYCATKAFLHSWLQSLRSQLRNSSVEVLELLPPYVQTELTGPHQALDPRAMPLADFVAEVMELLRHKAHPEGEIVVEAAKMYRLAERSNTYTELYAQRNHS